MTITLQVSLKRRRIVSMTALPSNLKEPTLMQLPSFSRRFLRICSTVLSDSPISLPYTRIIWHRSVFNSAATACTCSSPTLGRPRRAMPSHLSLKALTQLAAVLYGNAVCPHTSSSSWHYLVVRPCAHWIFNQLRCSCFVNMVNTLQFRPITHKRLSSPRHSTCALRRKG